MRIKNNTYSYINSFSKSIALFQSNRNMNRMYDFIHILTKERLLILPDVENRN